MTGYNFLNITPNELILFPTFLKFGLVYFKIYLKKNSNNFLGTVFEMCVNSNIFLNRIFEGRRNISSFGVHTAFPHIEGKHLEPWHNIFDVLVDTIITPPYFRKTSYFMW